jgi:mono/diheme cytochrome c family protein
MKGSRLMAALAFGVLVGWGGVTLLANDRDEGHPSDTFKQYCAKCHGEDGRADTPKGKQMKARNFTDADWQQSKSDSELIDSVTNGKDDDMPPFGKKLSKEQIESLVKNDVRSFAAKK